MIFIQSIIISVLYFVIISIMPHLKLKGAKPTIETYLYNVVGYIILTITLYSLILTKGNTIFVLILPFSCFLYFQLKNKLSFRYIINKIEIKFISILLIFFSIIYVIQFGLLFEFNSEYIKLPHSDYLFYSNVAKNLNKYQIESFHFSPLAHNIPYHYFELWLNAFLNLFGLKSYITLLLMVYPIILTLSCFTTFVLLNKNTIFEIKNLIISVSIIFMQLSSLPLIFDNIPFLTGDANVFNISVISYQKISIILLFFLISLLVYKNHGINYFLIFVSTGIAIYSPLILGLIGILFGATLLKIFNKKSKISYLSIFYFTFLIFTFQIFYMFNGYKSNFDIEFNIEFIKTIINIVAGTIIRLIAFSIVYIIIAIYIRKIIISQIQNNIELVIVIFIGCISSLFGWALTHRTLDSVQLFSNFSIPLIIIAIIFLVINNIKFPIQLIITILLILINTNKLKYNDNIQEISEIKNVFNPYKFDNGIFIKDTLEYNNKFNINPYFALYLGNLFLINDNLKMQDLSLVDIKYKNHNSRSLIDFYLQSNEYNIALKNNMVRNKADFIKKNKINFIIHKSNLIIDSSISNVFKNKIQYKSYYIHF